MLSESDYGHQALSDIIPLRDLFGLLFFVSVGMLLDPRFLWNHLLAVLTFTFIISLGKGILFASLVRLFKYRNVIPLAAGLGLFQIGEFSFVLGRAGQQAKVFPAEAYSLLLTTAVVTMLFTPLLSGFTAPLYAWRRRFSKREALQTVNLPDAALSHHVVIVGAGRVGQQIAQALARLRLSFVAVDADQFSFEQCKNLKFPAIYGDATHELVLEAARPAHARLLLVTTPSMAITRGVIESARHLSPTLPIIARAEGIQQVLDLNRAGVKQVVQPEFEAGLEMTRQALIHLDVPNREIQSYLDAVRQEVYAPLDQQDHDHVLMNRLRSVIRTLDLDWLSIPLGSPIDGKTLGASDIRTRTGISVVAVVRENRVEPNPPVEFELREGDWLGVLGTREQRLSLEHLLQPNGTELDSNGRG